jgi:hypothetical protein
VVGVSRMSHAEEEAEQQQRGQIHDRARHLIASPWR